MFIEDKRGMSKELFLNSFDSGKTYNYKYMQNKWVHLKENKNDPDYSFFAYIFAFDDDKHNYSESIFNKIAALDENEKTASKDKNTLSKDDINQLTNAANESSNFYTINPKAKKLDMSDFWKITLSELYYKIKGSKDEDEKSRFMNIYNPIAIFRNDKFYITDPDDNNRFLSPNEAQNKLDKKLPEAVKKIINYAKAHENDTNMDEIGLKIQKYAKILEAINKNHHVSTGIEHGGEDAVTIFGDNMCNSDKINNQIRIYYDGELNYTDELLAKNILHELGHIQISDLDSKSQEGNGDLDAIIMTERIFNEKLVKDEDKLAYKEFYQSLYKGLPLYGPGFGPSEDLKLPLNCGISTNQEPIKIKWESNQCIIHFKYDNTEKENLHTVVITYGEERDKNGNPLPIEIKKFVYDKDNIAVYQANVANPNDYINHNNTYRNGGYNLNSKDWNKFKRVDTKPIEEIIEEEEKLNNKNTTKTLILPNTRK